MTIATKIQSAMEGQSWIRQMFELGIQLKQRYGEDKVFDLSLGNPVLEPPDSVINELQRLLSAPPPGIHRYMPNAGYPETRAAIATYLAKQMNLQVKKLKKIGYKYKLEAH